MVKSKKKKKHPKDVFADIDPFTMIAQKIILEAEEVKVPFETFVAGLRTIMTEVKERLDMAVDELDAKVKHAK